MAFKFFNIGKANAEIESAHVAADAALTAAKITTLKVDGKDVPSADAPLANKIAAISAVAASGEKSQDISELIATNGQIAAQVETLTAEKATATATISAQSQKISTLEAALATEKASVSKLTAEASTVANLLDASNKECARLTKLNNEASNELSASCIAANCLDITGEDGKPLAKDATHEQKLAAANRLPFSARMAAFKGAVNAAVAKTGVTFAELPTAIPGASQASAPKFANATELCKAAVAAQATGKPAPQFQSFQKK